MEKVNTPNPTDKERSESVSNGRLSQTTAEKKIKKRATSSSQSPKESDSSRNSSPRKRVSAGEELYRAESRTNV